MNNRSRRSGYSLIEVMIAIVFVSIGFFGYVALHARLLHSGQRLEERERIRSATDLVEGIETARATQGYDTSIDGTEFSSTSSMEVPTLVWVNTKRKDKDNSWTSRMHGFRTYNSSDTLSTQAIENVDESFDLNCAVYPKPSLHRWVRR